MKVKVINQCPVVDIVDVNVLHFSINSEYIFLFLYKTSVKYTKSRQKNMYI